MKSLLKLALLFLLVTAQAYAEELSPKELVTLIQKGGYIVYFRHASTDHNQSDVDRSKLDDCSAQRNLDDKGRLQSRAIGEGFKGFNIPVGKILSSPWCRAKDTATLAFGRAEITNDLGFSISKSKEETERLSEALKAMLKEAPQSGTNTLLFAHTSNLKEATGIWPKPEGVMAVFKPDSSEPSGYKYFGMIPPSYWLSLTK